MTEAPIFDYATEVANWVAKHAPPPPTGQALNEVARALGTLRFPRETDHRLQHRLSLMLATSDTTERRTGEPA